MGNTISDTSDLQQLYDIPSTLVTEAFADRLEETTHKFISLSTLVMLSSCSADGEIDISPKGGEPGFVRIIDDRTLMLPDSPGNNKLHTFHNLVQNPNIGMMFIIPGIEEVVRVRGQAELLTNPEHIALFDDAKRPPKLVLTIKIDIVFPHCAKAFKYARIWDASAHKSRKEDDVPGIADMARSLAKVESS